jgi:hypothetical protein
MFMTGWDLFDNPEKRSPTISYSMRSLGPIGYVGPTLSEKRRLCLHSPNKRPGSHPTCDPRTQAPRHELQDSLLGSAYVKDIVFFVGRFRTEVWRFSITQTLYNVSHLVLGLLDFQAEIGIWCETPCFI